jgi:hypothetical protein
MDGINAQIGTQPDRDVTVADFWEKTPLPFVTEKKRHSTVYGYKKLWASNLKEHFGTRTLAEYRTADGYKYLESLTKTLGRNSLQHVRSLASGIFTRAVNRGLIDVNPWSTVRLQESTAPSNAFAANGKMWLNSLSQPRGTVQTRLEKVIACFNDQRTRHEHRGCSPIVSP